MAHLSEERPSRSARPARTTALAAPVLLLAAAGLIAGCSSSKSSSSPTTAAIGSAQATTSAASQASAGGDQVEVKNFEFTPDKLTVAVGTKVTWKFDDDTAHTVKADDGSFKSDALTGGKTFSFTFDKAGKYSYICSIHPSMKGEIDVQ
jgi:plastocyanin